MLLGRPARRFAPPILSAALAMAASTGCNALPWSSRVPDVAEVKTSLEGDRSKPSPPPTRPVEPTADRREVPEPIPETSPLPPALERPGDVRRRWRRRPP